MSYKIEEFILLLKKMHLSIMKLIMKIGMTKDRFFWSTQQDLDYHDDIVQIYI
jgi:hypothetical protein